jgi:hypothetical protein
MVEQLKESDNAKGTNKSRGKSGNGPRISSRRDCAEMTEAFGRATDHTKADPIRSKEKRSPGPWIAPLNEQHGATNVIQGETSPSPRSPKRKSPSVSSAATENDRHIPCLPAVTAFRGTVWMCNHVVVFSIIRTFSAYSIDLGPRNCSWSSEPSFHEAIEQYWTYCYFFSVDNEKSSRDGSENSWLASCSIRRGNIR